MSTPPAELPPAANGSSLLPRLAVLGLATLAAGHLWRIVRAHPSLPLWDEAAHGYAGVQVADAIRHFNPIELFLAINRQSVWPFVHSLILAPFFLAGGPGIASAEAASIVLWAATVLLLFFAGRALHPTRGSWVGLAAAALALVAPSWREFGTLAMLEMPGAFLLVLAFLLHARTLRDPAPPRALRWSGLAITALFFCKYNYGLLWMIPVAFLEWLLVPPADRARAAAAIRRRLTWRWWRRPVPALLALGVLAAFVIEVTGGGEFRISGQRVSVRSAGNLAYALFLVALAWLLVPRRGRDSRLAWLRTRTPDRVRALTGPLFATLAIWFALPGHVREFLGFLSNRADGPPPFAPRALAFYPRAFADDYSFSRGAGMAVMLLAALVLFTLPRRRRGEAPAPRGPADLATGLAFVAAFLGAVLTEAHEYRESRFFFTVAPLVWLCAARTAVSAVDAVLRRLAWRPAREGLWSALAVVLVAAAWIGAPFDVDVRTRREALRSPIALVPALDAILDGLSPRLVAPDYRLAAFDGTTRLEPAPAPDINRDFPARAVLLGYSNVLSPGLLAWWARIARPEIRRDALPKRAPYLAPGAEDVELDARARWVADHADVAISAFAGALPRPLVGEYRNEVWADRETVARLADSGQWTRVSDTRAGPWKVTVFERNR